MSETQGEPGDAPKPDAAAPKPAPDAASQPRPAAAAWRAAALALAAALLLTVALVATAPWWAPLLPWGPAASDRGHQHELAARLDRVDAAVRRVAATVAALQAQPAASAGDLAALRQQLGTVAGTVAGLGKRVGAVEKAQPAGDIAGLQRRLGQLSDAVADLAKRQGALADAAQAQAARAAGDAALMLAVAQIRDALAAGRPFAAPYATLARVARGRPDLERPVQPLSEPAKAGVASRAALAAGLRRLAAAVTPGTLGTPTPPPAENSRTGAMLARLRGLVTIRRIDGAALAGGPAPAVAEAQRRLAAGDLAGAAAALAALSGAPAEAAAPWLRQVRQRLAAEAALRQVEAAVAAQFGAGAGAATGAGAAQ
jgi:hypothetical protein